MQRIDLRADISISDPPSYSSSCLESLHGNLGGSHNGEETEEGETTTDLYYTIITDYDFSVEPKYKPKLYEYNTEVGFCLNTIPFLKKCLKSSLSYTSSLAFCRTILEFLALLPLISQFVLSLKVKSKKRMWNIFCQLNKFMQLNHEEVTFLIKWNNDDRNENLLELASSQLLILDLDLKVKLEIFKSHNSKASP